MNRLHPTWRWGLSALAVVCALTFALPLILNDSETPDGAAGFAPGEAAMRASIDPETGALVTGVAFQGDKALGAEMREMMSRSSEGLVQEIRPDGSASVRLQGRFMSATVARLDEDGQPETMCTENADEAADFLAGESVKPETDANGWEVR